MRTAQEKPLAKEKLMDAAYALMVAKGYVATSVDEICAKAGLTKGSFFHYFEHKEDLAKALLKRACAGVQRPAQPKDALQRVYQHIDCAIEMSKKPDAAKGCLLGTFAQELSDTHPEIRAICSQGFDHIMQCFVKDLKEAKAKHAPRAAFDPKSLAQHYIAILEGSLILAKVHRNRKIMAQNLEHFRAYLKSLFKS